MQLRSRSLTGVIQPLSYVDKMLRQQGFRRTGGKHPPIYDLVIYDSATSTSYFLRIPTSVTHSNSRDGEISVKIGHPYLETRFFFHGTDEEFVIPREVRRAAEHKLAEIADYLAPYVP